MRRLLPLLIAAVLANLPLAHETWVDHRIATQGVEVTAHVTGVGTVQGRHLVDYRLTRKADPRQRRFSARVDADGYRQARETRALQVRAVPGDPAMNRPDTAVGSSVVWVVTIFADVVVLLVVLLFWQRSRTRRGFVLDSVDHDAGTVGLTLADVPVQVLAPSDWLASCTPGRRVSGRVHLVPERDLLPCAAGPPLVPTGELATYVVRGRVVDIDPRTVLLALEGERASYALYVEHRKVRVRADLREYAETRGTVHFTPSGLARRPR